MQTEILTHIKRLKQGARRKIAEALSGDVIEVVARHAFAFHFSDRKSLAFQEYYGRVTGNREAFLKMPGFFREFKAQYSLQGIDNDCLDRFEKKKRAMLELIETDRLAELYDRHFTDVKVKHGAGTSRKNLGSFFAKLVHTFKPDMYCALDNPIKDALGLKNESFYIAFLVVSAAYREWARENPGLMRRIRAELERNETGRAHSPAMTDLKLLDLVFWHLANRPS